jgi:hypothetical protein
MATKSLKIVKTGPEILKTALFYTFAADIPIIMKTVPIRGKLVSGLARTAPVMASVEALVTALAEAPELVAQRTGAPSQSIVVPDNLKTWFNRLQERLIPLFLRPAIDCEH